MRNSPTKNLKLQYRKLLELGLIVSLALHILLMQGFKRVKVKTSQRSIRLAALQVEEIPQTQQEKQAPAPARPSVPIASEDEDLPEDETIEETIFDLFADAAPLPPPPMDDDVIVFIPYDEPPMPVGGFEEIQRRLVYPEIARKAGVEGRVTVYAKISEIGSVIRTKVVQSLGPNGCDEAAVNAIRSVKWNPAKQRDRPVTVWIAIPVDFRLR